MSREIEVEHLSNIHLIRLNQYPDICGLCHKNIDPTYLAGSFVRQGREGNFLELVFQCPNIACNSLIIGYYRRSGLNNFYFIKNTPLTPQNKKFSEEIEEVSKKFTKIYNEAYFAEQENLTLISGIGYRKAIEFLVKDYLIYLDNQSYELILKMPLNQCIEKLDNQDIKEMARRAAWLGNDEAHYSKKWENKDVQDLKKIIDITLHFISMDIASKKYLLDMS